MFYAKKIIVFSALLAAGQLGKAASTVNTSIVSMETWDTHIDRLLNDEPQLEALYTKEASLYDFARQECLNVLTMLQQNAQAFRATFTRTVEEKEGAVRNIALLNDEAKKAVVEQMQVIIDAAKDKIAVVTKEVEFLTTYKDELKLVYQGIMSQGVTRAANLEKGIERLEIVFDSALEAKKKFLDAVFLLLHEAEEMVSLVTSTGEATDAK